MFGGRWAVIVAGTTYPSLGSRKIRKDFLLEALQSGIGIQNKERRKESLERVVSCESAHRLDIRELHYFEGGVG